MGIITFIITLTYLAIGLGLMHWHTTKLLRHENVPETHTMFEDIRIIFLWPKEYKRIKEMK